MNVSFTSRPVVVLNCPIEGCICATGNIEAAQAVAHFLGHGYSHAPGACQQAEPDKLSCPKVSKKSMSGDWEHFITRRDAYKTATRIADYDATLQLLACCEGSLRKDLHRSHSNIATATETNALAAIKCLAVKADSAMVSRMTLKTMKAHDREVDVRNFAAHLPVQAKVCLQVLEKLLSQAIWSSQLHQRHGLTLAIESKVFIDRIVKPGVLESFPVEEPVTWCQRMVTAENRNGKPRRTKDMQVLKNHAALETRQSPFHQATLVPSGTKKTIIDAWNGYHGVPMREEDRHFTSFIPHGVGTILPTGLRGVTGRVHQKIPESSTIFSKTFPTKPNASITHAYGQTHSKTTSSKHVAGLTFAVDTELCRIPKSLYLAPTRWSLLASSPFRTTSSSVTNKSAQSVTCLRHKTSLTSDLGSASSTKCRTANPSATTLHLSASISSRRQRSIGMISYSKFLSNPRLLYWTKSPRVSGYSIPNLSHIPPQIGPRKTSVSGSCRVTAHSANFPSKTSFQLKILTLCSAIWADILVFKIFKKHLETRIPSKYLDVFPVVH